MASQPSQSPAADAAAYIRGSGDLIPRSRGDSLELRKQCQRLRKWAEKTGRLIHYNPPHGPRTGGAEHEVFFHQKESRVFKRTYPGTFGSAPTDRGLRRTATPYFYLVRLELLNEVFGLDMKLEGVTGDELLSMLISQAWVHPADPRNPLPSPAEIAEFMCGLGFEPTSRPYEWHRKADEVLVSDARPDNFIRSKLGVVPIDLIASREENDTEARA